jgi:phage shock protein PspC (stress-responsive transcriptional regulator)
MDITTIPAVVQTIVKIMVLVGLGIYTIFAYIIVRQEQLMDKVIDETFEPVLRLLVLLHFLMAIGLVVIAFIIL